MKFTYFTGLNLIKPWYLWALSTPSSFIFRQNLQITLASLSQIFLSNLLMLTINRNNIWADPGLCSDLVGEQECRIEWPNLDKQDHWACKAIKADTSLISDTFTAVVRSAGGCLTSWWLIFQAQRRPLWGLETSSTKIAHVVWLRGRERDSLSEHGVKYGITISSIHCLAVSWWIGLTVSSKCW